MNTIASEIWFRFGDKREELISACRFMAVARWDEPGRVEYVFSDMSRIVRTVDNGMEIL